MAQIAKMPAAGHAGPAGRRLFPLQVLPQPQNLLPAHRHQLLGLCSMKELDDTIADIKRQNLSLEIRCLACGRSTLLPPKFIPPRLTDDLPVALAAGLFRCSNCKGKQLQSSMVDRTAKKPPSGRQWGQ